MKINKQLIFPPSFLVNWPFKKIKKKVTEMKKMRWNEITDNICR